MMKNMQILAISVFLFLTLIVSGCDDISSKPEIEVTFDGKECTVSGPTELPLGEVTTKFFDLSDLGGELWIVYLKEGKTFQDHLDLQSEQGEWVPKPSWVSYNSRISGKSEESKGKRIDTEIWNLDRAGEHVIFCYVSSPQMLWNAAPLFISENSIE